MSMILLEPAYKIFHTSVKFKRRTISVTPFFGRLGFPLRPAGEPERMTGMLDRIRLALMRSNQWVGDLSPAGRRALIVIVVVLLFVAGYFGLLPSKNPHRNPHSLIDW